MMQFVINSESVHCVPGFSKMGQQPAERSREIAPAPRKPLVP